MPHTTTEISFADLNPTVGSDGAITSDIPIRLSAQFYGPNHEEVAGRFNIEGITGAFGVRRSAALTEIRRYERDVAALLADSNSGFNDERGLFGTETELRLSIVEALIAPSTISLAGDGSKLDVNAGGVLYCGFRGDTNLLSCIGHSADFIADLRNISPETLSDAPLRRQAGINLTDVRGAGDNSGVRRFGGWMEHAGFHLYTGVPVEEVLAPFQAGQTFTIADAFGSKSGSAPNATATYLGAMVGTPAHGQANHGDVLAGDAALVYDANDDSVDLDFTEIVNVDRNGRPHTTRKISFAALNLSYDATSRWIASTVDGNETALSARFYGYQQEVAGVFNHMDVMGSFGAKRVPRPFFELRRARLAIQTLRRDGSFNNTRDDTLSLVYPDVFLGSHIVQIVGAICGFGANADVLTCKGEDVFSSDIINLDADLRGGTPRVLRAVGGLQLTDVRGVGDNSGTRRFGGWMEHAGFYLYTDTDAQATPGSYSSGYVDVDVEAVKFHVADSFGNASADRPSENAIYKGAMAGTQELPTDDNGDVLVGDAALRFTAETGAVTLDFTNIINLDGGTVPASSISFVAVAAADGAGAIIDNTREVRFRYGPNGDDYTLYGPQQLRAQFYGPNHEEVAGRFSRSGIVGAFGVKRQEPSPALRELWRTKAAIEALLGDGDDSTLTNPRGGRFARAGGYYETDGTHHGRVSHSLRDGRGYIGNSCGFGTSADRLDCTFRVRSWQASERRVFRPTLTLAADLRGGEAKDLRHVGGINLTDVRGVGDNSGVRRYGGWMEHSGFYLYTDVPASGDGLSSDDMPPAILESLGDAVGDSPPAILDSFGDASGGEPSENATYKGAMVGKSSGNGHLDVLVGDAALTFYANDPTVTLNVTNIFNVDKGMPHSRTWLSFEYEHLRSRSSGYITPNFGNLSAHFYGPNHEEIAGHFEHGNIFGAFGVKRQEPSPAWRELWRAKAAIEALLDDGDDATLNNTRDGSFAGINPTATTIDGTNYQFSDLSCGFHYNADRLGCTSSASGIEHTLYLWANLRGGDPGDLREVGGIQLTDVEAAAGDVAARHDEESDVRRFGAWMDHAGFYLYTDVRVYGSIIDGHALAIADSFGNASDNRPSGDATYKGAMVGSPLAIYQDYGDVLVGDAALGYTASTGAVTLDFTKITNIDGGSVPGGITSLSFADVNPVAGSDGAITSNNSSAGLSGHFYGPNHEEVAGRFNHKGITGAFGVKQQATP
ncbi:MAG: hypothetical protein GDA40_12215 [Rhodobacteraceae bacterium]|nr:hypothetical protein [Paracoccaceae bacterium]